MQYFLRRAVILWLILLAAICIAIFSRRTNEDKLSAFSLDICDGKPCFAGITPGVTQWDDVRKHLIGFNVWLESEDRVGVMLSSTIAADIERFPGTPETVTLIDVSDGTITEFTPTIFPSVADFILKYGIPCWVLLDTHGQSENRLHVSRLVYPTMTLDVDIDKPFIPSAPVGGVQMMNGYGPDDLHDLCANEQNSEKGLTWAGFASHDRYLDALIKKQNTTP